MNYNRPYFRLGLTGYPLDHSLSPALHTRALEETGLRGEYRLYPAVPGLTGEGSLGDLIGRLKSGKLHGLNVTIPHKQTVIPMLDSLSPSAQAIGAVNTIYMENGYTVGENTDAGGFWVDLQRHMKPLISSPTEKPPIVMVLGAGGAARAVLYALGQAGWKVILAARRKEQALELAHQFSGTVEGIIPLPFRSQDLHSIEGQRLGMVVNTTPLGMFPDEEFCPWPEGIRLPERTLVYDLVYRPATTRLMQLARSQGLKAFNGLGMLVEQAALAFEIWTGESQSREGMWRALSIGVA